MTAHRDDPQPAARAGDLRAGGVGEAELLVIAEAAARAAAHELLSRFDRSLESLRSKSSPTDPVSEADLAAEAAIRGVLARERPGDGILGEEGGVTAGEGSATGIRWVVDPLDGTVNYLYGIPTFAVSVACEDAAGAIAGVVLEPLRDECFAATRSGAATLDREPIHCSAAVELARALVGTGFSYEAAVREPQARVVARLLPRVRDIRRAGSAALDLCACACGRLDAYYERGLHAWDCAAGGLICARAGLSVRQLAPQDGMPDGLLVAPAALIDELHALVA